MEPDTAVATANRWAQLWLGFVCMVLIANLQYSWTLFVNPLHDAHGWSIAAIQVAFSIFIATETWLTPIVGWIVDHTGARRGPPLMVGLGAVLVALAWVINAQAQSIGVLYLGAALSGSGAGAIYATCVGNAVKWFPDRRGLAVGLTAGGFGAGAALTVIPIRLLIDSAGYASTFFWFGIGQGVVLLLIAPVLRAPPANQTLPRSEKVRQTGLSLRPAEVLRMPVFWLLYAMFVLVSGSGLMATAQIGPIAHDYGLNRQALIFGASALSVTLVVDNVMNGMARPLFGWVSDHIGREYTMAIAFTTGAAAYLLLGLYGASPWGFLLSAALIFFTWGEIFSLFPSTCTDLFGPGYATTNAMMLYTAKGTSAWFVPLANMLRAASGGWQIVFVGAALLNLIVVLAALFLLRPMHLHRHPVAHTAAKTTAV